MSNSKNYIFMYNICLYVYANTACLQTTRNPTVYLCILNMYIIYVYYVCMLYMYIIYVCIFTIKFGSSLSIQFEPIGFTKGVRGKLRGGESPAAARVAH